MAPEQLPGGNGGPSADVYAWALVAYEMLEGFLPGLVRREGRGGLRAAGPAVEHLLERFWETDPALRPRDGGELPLAIDEALAANGPTAGHGMGLIPAGWFLRESDDGDGEARADERPCRRIWLDRFCIDRVPVTVAPYRAFVVATGAATLAHRGRTAGDDRRRPVAGLSWDDAAAHARWAGKRLATEAGWEKAARGGLPSARFPWGDEDPVGRAWFAHRWDAGAPPAVGRLAANGYGPLDTAGLLWEWVADWYAADAFAKASERNPAGPCAGTERMCRDGSWVNGPAKLRSAARHRLDPRMRTPVTGFRCARSSGSPSAVGTQDLALRAGPLFPRFLGPDHDNGRPLRELDRNPEPDFLAVPGQLARQRAAPLPARALAYRQSVLQRDLVDDPVLDVHSDATEPLCVGDFRFEVEPLVARPFRPVAEKRDPGSQDDGRRLERGHGGRQDARDAGRATSPGRTWSCAR